MHIDCDLYSSTKVVLNNMSSLLTAGTVLLFDEFYYVDHEYRAFMEFIADQNRTYEYLARSLDQLCLIMLD